MSAREVATVLGEPQRSQEGKIKEPSHTEDGLDLGFLSQFPFGDNFYVSPLQINYPQSM